jgi:hypothetical protein
MPEKRMLIIPAEVVRKIDENRGDMSQGDFIEFLIDSQIGDKAKAPADAKKYATKEEIRFFEEDIKQLLKSFLDFFVSYGMELGKQSPQSELEELTSKLHELEGGLGAEIKSQEVKEGKIKWK